MFSSNLDKRWRWSAGAIAVLFAMLMTSSHGARVGDGGVVSPRDARVVGHATAKKAITVDLRTAPVRATVPMPPGFNYNRPTPRAGTARGGPAPSRRKAAKAARSGPGDPLSLLIAVPSVNQNTAGGIPPDGDIATSPGFTVQMNRFGVTMYNLNTGTLAKQVNFATFFNDGTNLFFTPRVIFDPLWNRFVALVDAQDMTTGHSFFTLAISLTSDPTGQWIMDSIDPGLAPGDFADFPQLGMDLNSIIITYNNFLAGGGFVALTFSVAKAYLYNGLFPNVLVFDGGSCTIAPPYVLDNGSPSYMLAACPGDNGVSLIAMTNTGLSNVDLALQAKVATIAFGTPPCAPQPGVSYCLETSLDSRFENRSAQIGEEIWNVNVVQNGTATPQWYEFNTGNSTLVASDQWFASATSSDWHPSIVVNGVDVAEGLTGETFGTWMSVDAANNLNLQLFAIGGSEGNAGFGAGIAVGPASAQPLTSQTIDGRNRSGDFSYISMYPAPALGCQANEIAILEGEVSLGTIWGTEVGVVKHC